MPVYIRTTAGTAAALNPLAKLPRNLRQLLVAIDGSTPSSTHAARMANPADIDVLLELLERAGLVRQAAPAGAQHGDAAVVQPSQDAAAPVAVAAAPSAPVADAFANFGSETAPAGLRPTGAVYYELGNVISLMSDFVTRHLPERSLEIVLALEGLASIGQVVSSLDDYRTLITPLGDPAQHHLAELQRMLDAA